MDHYWIGLIAAGVLAGAGYFLGAPLEAVLIAIAVGTIIEYVWINRSSGD